MSDKVERAIEIIKDLSGFGPLRQKMLIDGELFINSDLEVVEPEDAELIIGQVKPVEG